MPLCVPESILLLSNVCQKCAEPLPTRGTGRCVAEQSPLERLHGSYLYDTPVGPAIKALKFDDVRAVGAVLGTMLNIGSGESKWCGTGTTSSAARFKIAVDRV